MSDVEKLDSEIYKCPNCGNFLYYDPKSKKLKCDYCNTLEECQPVADAQELEFYEGVENEFVGWGEVKSVKCRSCGAVSILPSFEVVSNCPFCNASNVVDADGLEGLRPNAILPFGISKTDVPDIYRRWLKSKTLAPSKLKKFADRQPCKGTYIPVFTFDAQCDALYSIRYGKYYTVTVGSGKNRRTETRIRWYHDSGEISDFFNDVQIEASKSITQTNLSKLGGFDSDNAVEYHSQFLSGYSAERYDKSLDESWEDAQTVMRESLRRSIVEGYNADVVDYVHIDCNYSQRTYKYVLVPIWIFNYLYRKKNYPCIVNGRSGRMIGKYPKSPVKIGSIVLAVAAAIGLAAWIYLKFFA